jgi:hypothetical protein
MSQKLTQEQSTEQLETPAEGPAPETESTDQASTSEPGEAKPEMPAE